MIRRLACGAIACAALTLAVASAASALTVDRERVFEGGHRFEVRCGEPETYTWALPAGAQSVELLEPAPGDAVTDGFGDTRVGTVRDVVQRTGPDAALRST